MSADTGPQNTSYWGHLKLYIYHFMNTTDFDRISQPNSIKLNTYVCCRRTSKLMSNTGNWSLEFKSAEIKF